MNRKWWCVVGEIIGLLLFALIYGVFWFLSQAANKATEKQKQNAAEHQRKLMAAHQHRQDSANRAVPNKKYREIEQLRNKNDELLATLVTAETVSPPQLKRESIFDAPIDSVPSELAGDTFSMVKPSSEHSNPIAQGILTMMTTPQTMQQAVILSEIFNRPKFEWNINSCDAYAWRND